MNPNDVLLFGDKLRACRVKIGLPTLDSIAKAIGVASTQIFNWENGLYFPKEDRLPLIAKVYMVDLIELQEIYKISMRVREEAKKARKVKKIKRGCVPEEGLVAKSIISVASSAPKGYVPRYRYSSYYRRNFT